MEAAIAFLTLFLGLVSGPQIIDLTTTSGVATVDLVLDEGPPLRLVGPPWTTRVDFGPDLQPHELLAVARNADGFELGRARQLINAARPPAEVRVLVERDAKGRARSARWIGAAVSGAKPEIEMTFDGRALDVDADGRATLPPFDVATPHVLSALVSFGPTVSARHDLVLGGEINDQTRVELTAVAFELPAALRRKRALDLNEVEVLLDGQPIRATAIDRGPAQVYVVRPSELAEPVLRRLGARGRPPSKSALGLSGGGFDGGDRSARRFEASLERDDRVRMIWPQPTAAPGASLPTRLFQGSREFRGDGGGFFWLLGSVQGPRETIGVAPRFADAVAVAGLQALASGRRRAVVLLLDATAGDPSFYDPESVRRFLSTLRVPLFVWSTSERPPLGAIWGGAAPIDSPRALERAVGELREVLDRQRILWVPGVLSSNRVAIRVSTN